MNARSVSAISLAGALVLVLGLTLAAHAPALDNGFTNWDDPAYVTANPAIRSLAPGAVAGLFTSFHLGNYHPLTMLSLAVDYALFGPDPRAFHAVNLLLHLANALLLFLLLRIGGCSLAGSTVAALLFGVHPVQVESVAWVAGRKNLLSTFFFFGALIAWLRRRRPAAGACFHPLPLALFACALLAKGTAVTFPLVLILIGRLKERAPWRAVIRETAPFVAIGIFVAVVALAAQSSAGALRFGGQGGPLRGLFLASHGLIFYLGKLLFPVGLAAFYPAPDLRAALPATFRLAPAVVFPALLAFVFLGRRRPLAFIGGLFFLITLLPTLQLVPLGNTAAADRYLYLPAAGIFLVAGESLAALVKRAAGAGRIMIIAGSAALLLTLAVLSRERTGTWRDSLTLWNDVIARYPTASPFPYGNRALAHAERGEAAAAIADLDRALAIDGSSARAYLLRGKLNMGLGNLAEAEKDFSASLARDRGLEEARRLRETVWAPE